jgi:hypothetical protein
VLTVPANFCLLPKYADELKARLASGALDLRALSRMSSGDRRAAFAEIMGDANAQHVNAAFESKLLLEQQQRGLRAWIKESTEGKPELQRDLLARVQRMDRILEPDDNTGFLEDLARQKLGFGVTMDEAGRIAELSKAAADARTALENGTGDRIAYGRAKVEFSNYVSELKNAVREPLTVGTALKNTAGFSKSMLAAFDNSALLRQGWKNLFAHPELWYKNAKQSFVDMAQQFGGKNVLDEVQADILSRPNALNGRYRKAGLAIGNIEEAFPTSLPEKVPALGRAYKASEAAFTGFQYRMRADVFDKYMEIAEQSGVDLRDREQLESIGKLVNSLTSRGHLGAAEPAANVVNVLFFSGRKLKSDLDFLTAHQLEAGVTPFVRKQAAINLAKVVTGTAAILAIAHAVAPGSVEWDPRSSDFGKIRVGNTRFDVTGGMSSILTLAARLATMSSKSSTTHRVSPVNSGKFGAATGTDLVYNFFENKLSPAAGVVRDLLKGETRNGGKPTLASEATSLVTPLPVSNALELSRDPNSAGVLLGSLADALGVATTNYDGKKRHKGK